jgi:hypothetical protein
MDSGAVKQNLVELTDEGFIRKQGKFIFYSIFVQFPSFFLRGRRTSNPMREQLLTHNTVLPHSSVQPVMRILFQPDYAVCSGYVVR